MAHTISKLVTKLIRAFRHHDVHAAPYGFAKGEFAGRRRSIDR